MIKLECDRSGLARLEVAGTTPEVTAELLASIRELYCKMHEINEENAEFFKNAFMSGVELLFLSDEEIEKKIEEETEKSGKNIINDLDKLKKSLEDLKNAISELNKTEGEA